jgi:hypothetical protein
MKDWSRPDCRRDVTMKPAFSSPVIAGFNTHTSIERSLAPSRSGVVRGPRYALAPPKNTPGMPRLDGLGSTVNDPTLVKFMPAPKPLASFSHTALPAVEFVARKST